MEYPGKVGTLRPETAWEREQREKKAAAGDYVCNATAPAPNNYGDTCHTEQPRAVTLREQAEKQVGYHREQADRNDRALAFFRENPAFDQFVRLVREGVIQF